MQFNLFKIIGDNTEPMRRLKSVLNQNVMKIDENYRIVSDSDGLIRAIADVDAVGGKCLLLQFHSNNIYYFLCAIFIIFFLLEKLFKISEKMGAENTTFCSIKLNCK